MSEAHHPLRTYVGTTVERGAFSPPAEAIGASWWDTDRAGSYIWTGTAWVGVHALTSPDGATDPVLSADNSGNVTLAGTGTLTIPTDLIHAGDSDTKLSFTDDQWDLTVGGINMIRADETTQDVLYLGDVVGSGDVDIDFSNGQMFLQGSSGNLGLQSSGITLGVLQIGDAFIFETDGSGAATNVNLTRNAYKDGGFKRMVVDNDASLIQMDSAGNFSIAGNTDANTAIGSAITFKSRFFIAGGTGLIGINGVTSPSTELDIGAGAIEGEEMSAPGAGAVNTWRLYGVDNGGKTEVYIIFNTGAAQLIAAQP